MIAALAVAGCGGGGATRPRRPRRPRRRLRRPRRRPWRRVTDGDTGAPVAGAAVEAPAEPSWRAPRPTTTGGRRSLGTAAVTATAPRYTPARARARGRGRGRPLRPAAAEPGVRRRLAQPLRPGREVPPPAGRPAWTFESRTLLEFPPAVSDGLAVIGTNSGRVYALDDDGSLVWARRQKGRSPPAPRSRAGGPSSARWAASSSPTAWGRAPALDLLGRQPDRELAADRRRAGLRRHLGGGPPRRRRRHREAALALPGARRHQGQRRPGERADRGGRLLGQPARPRPALGRRALDVHGRRALLRRPGRQRGHHRDRRRGRGGHRPRRPGGGERWRALDRRRLRLLDRRDRRRGRLHRLLQRQLPGPRPRRRLGALVLRRGRQDLGLGHRRGRRRLHRAPVRPGQPRRTYGLDVRTGAVRFETDEGRYSPAVGAGRTLYLVGTRHLYAHPAPAR